VEPPVASPAVAPPVVEHRALPPKINIPAREAVALAPPAASQPAQPLGPRPLVVERRRGPMIETSAQASPAELTSPTQLASPVAPQREDTTVEITRHQVDKQSGNVTTTAVVLRNADAWRELFDRRSRGAALARQSQTKQGPARPTTASSRELGPKPVQTAGASNNKIDPDFLRRIQDKKTPSRDNRTGTRG
jgi:hypothetical protein